MKEYRERTGRGARGPSTEKRPGQGPIPADCIHVFVYPDPGIVYRYPLYTGIPVCSAGGLALHFAKALKFRFSAKNPPFCDLSVRSEKVLKSCKM